MMVTKTSELIKLIRKLAREECCDKLKSRTKAKKKTHLRKAPTNISSKILTSLFAQALVKRQLIPKRPTTAIQQTQTVPLSHTKTQTTQTKTKAKSMKTQTAPADRHSIGTDTTDDFDAIIEKISAKPAQTVTAKDIRAKTTFVQEKKMIAEASRLKPRDIDADTRTRGDHMKEQKRSARILAFRTLRERLGDDLTAKIMEPVLHGQTPTPKKVKLTPQQQKRAVKTMEELAEMRRAPIPTAVELQGTDERVTDVDRTVSKDAFSGDLGFGKTKPEDSKVALSDRQINEYMARKQRTRFKGAISRDQIKDVKLNKTTPSSFIFNTAPTTQDGEHWCAVYVDPKKRHLCYYDSFGRDPETDIIADLTNLVHKLRKMQFQMKINRIQEQDLRSHHCGHHCLRFLNKMHSPNSTFIQSTPFHSQEEEARKIAKGFGYV